MAFRVSTPLMSTSYTPLDTDLSTPHAGGGVGLGVKVAQKHPLPQVFQGRSQVDTGGGLPNAAFLIHDRHDFRHFVHTRFLSVFILVYHIFGRFQ